MSQLALPVPADQVATMLRVDFGVDFRVVPDDGGLVEIVDPIGGDVVHTILATGDLSADLLRARDQLAHLSAAGHHPPSRLGAYQRTLACGSLRRAADLLHEAAAHAAVGAWDRVAEILTRSDLQRAQGVRLLGVTHG